MKLIKILSFIICYLGLSIIKANANTFYLYNHANLKAGLKPDNQLSTDYIQEHLSEILPDITDITADKKYPLSQETIGELTDLSLGQKVLIIGKDYITTDNIQTINLLRLENNGEFLITFDFKSTYDGIYLVPSTRLKHNEEPQNVSGTKFSLKTENDLAESTAKFVTDYSTRSYLSKKIVTAWNEDVLSELKRDFASESFGSPSFSISQYTPIGNQDKVDFVMARFGKSEFILFPSIFLNIFKFEGRYHILVEGYTPGTGASGRILYLLDGGTLTHLTSNYDYAD